MKITDIYEPPEPLKSLLDGTSAHSQHFQGNIRRYNSCFQMTSFGAEEVRLPGYFPTFKVCGQIYHRAGAILPQPGEEPKFLQIYFMGDHNQEAQRRCGIVEDVRLELVLDLQKMLHETNNIVRSFKTALEQAPSEDMRVVIHADRTPAGEHERRYNAPQVNEVAIVIIGQEFNRRDIVIHCRNDQLQRISETHRSYDALQYPLINWEGQDGYCFQIWQFNPTTGLMNVGKKVSANDYYAYRIMHRQNSFNIILRCRQLFHQYIVDMYAKIESERLLFIRTHQQQLRVADYIHLRDSLTNDGHANVGQLVILPSSFTGGPRYMAERTQDAMTYVRTFGRPDLFITLTCNPQWPEIVKELLPGQVAHDRHDLIARVFQRKVILLIDLMMKFNVCGSVAAYMYTVTAGCRHVARPLKTEPQVESTRPIARNIDRRRINPSVGSFYKNRNTPIERSREIGSIANLQFYH